jgi:hypothetical protein
MFYYNTKTEGGNRDMVKREFSTRFFIGWSKLWTQFNEHVLEKDLDKILHSTSPLIACFAACVNALHLIVRLYTWMLSAVILNIMRKKLRRSGEGGKGRCLPWSKEEDGAYIFWMQQVPVDRCARFFRYEFKHSRLWHTISLFPPSVFVL